MANVTILLMFMTPGRRPWHSKEIGLRMQTDLATDKMPTAIRSWMKTHPRYTKRAPAPTLGSNGRLQPNTHLNKNSLAWVVIMTPMYMGTDAQRSLTMTIRLLGMVKNRKTTFAPIFVG